MKLNVRVCFETYLIVSNLGMTGIALEREEGMRIMKCFKSVNSTCKLVKFGKFLRCKLGMEVKQLRLTFPTASMCFLRHFGVEYTKSILIW